MRYRIRKTNGMWVARRPGGGHIGSFFTHAEALLRVTSRLGLPNVRSSSGGYFERAPAWHMDGHRPFGFSQEITT